MNNLHERSQSPSKQAIVEQLNRITQSKVLGRSKINCKLINYLVDYYLSSLNHKGVAKSPKEYEIATNALDKEKDFNPAEDASVRVYVSNLRKKLDTYYQTEGIKEEFQILIPTGGYSVEFQWVQKQNETIKTTTNKNKKKPLLSFAITISLLLNIAFLIYYVLGESDESIKKNTDINTNQLTRSFIHQHPLWKPLFTSPKPTLIVIGDLYMLTEVDPHTQKLRAVREFGINSNKQFKEYLDKYPDKRNKLNKASSAFLLKSSVFSLQHILPLFTEDSPATIRLASDLTATDLREYNIIYLGLYKSLGILDAYLEGSNYELTNTTSLRHKYSDRVYTVTGDLEQEYTDYGSFAQFDGPSGNHFYILAGFSDASVIQIAKYLTSQTRLTSPEFVQHFQSIHNKASHFELIFSASSFNRTDLDSNLIDTGLLDIKSIWAMPQ